MLKIEFEEDYSKIFAGAGLESFDDIYSYSDGEVVNINKKRDVSAFALNSGGVKKEFFIKRFGSPYFKDMAFAGFKSGHICSQG